MLIASVIASHAIIDTERMGENRSLECEGCLGEAVIAFWRSWD